MKRRMFKLGRLLGIVATVLLINFNLSTGASAKTDNSGEQGSSNGQPFKTLQTRIDQLGSDFEAAVADLQAQIDDLVASQAAQDTIIAAIQTAATLLQDRVAANESDIEALQAADLFQVQLIQALDDRLTALELRVSANEEDIAALILADQTMQAMISAIQGEITILNQRIDANDADIADLESEIGLLNTQLTSLQAELATKQNRVNGVCGAGSSIRQINADGSVVCEVDTVSAGVGSFVTTNVTRNAEIPGAGLFAGSLTLSAWCPSTYRVTGGGYSVSGYGDVWDGDERLVAVVADRHYGNSWRVSAYNDNVVICAFGSCSGKSRLYVYAKCGRVQ